MSSVRAWSLVIGLLLLPATFHAQRATEWQIHAIGNMGADRFIGGGVGLALRTNGRMRVGIAVSGGSLEGNAALRPEIVGSFHLNPFKRQGVSPYAGGGVAAVLAEGSSSEYMVGFLGIESQPGRAFGWFAEFGFGGGARIVAGVQFRHRHRRAR